MFGSLIRSGPRYSRVDGSNPWLNWLCWTNILQILCFVAAAVLCFSAGRYSKSLHVYNNIDLRTEAVTFRYDRSFGGKPSNNTDQAWKTLFPAQGGFFKHPQLAKERSALSVFHQLHCLDGIRQGYWTYHDAVVSGANVEEHSMPMEASPAHIRHCIDLLRQALMCQPDTTIELKNKELGGVTGFGTEHRCKDWTQLMEWTSTWEKYDQDERPLKEEHIHGSEGQHGHGGGA